MNASTPNAPDDQSSRLVDGAAEPEEAHAELSLRPQSLGEFIGQESLKQNLGIFIEAARQRREAMDHVLLYGPPGLGKTTLAQIVARELGVGFRATSGPVVAKSGDLAAILTALQAHDVLFIDEIHRLNPTIEEVLYPAMEDFKLDIILGEGPSARSIRIDLPPFTLVGATTRAGLVTTALRDRFGIPLHMDFYTTSELATILQRNAGLLKVEISQEAALLIATRSRGTPRVAGRVLRRVRDIAAVAGAPVLDEATTLEALRRLGLDDQGFDKLDHAYLRTLGEVYRGGPVGLETLAATLAHEADILEDVVEPFLMKQGMVQRTSRGRVLTQEGAAYIGMEAPHSLL